MFLGPAICIDGFANLGYILVSTFDLLGPGQHKKLIHSIAKMDHCPGLAVPLTNFILSSVILVAVLAGNCSNE